MDRDREDDPRRSLGRGGGPREPGEGRAGKPGRFDMSDWDTPTGTPADPPTNPLPVSAPAARARDDADAAKAFSMFSAIETGIQRLLANFGMVRDLVADVRATVADIIARDAKRAEDEAARDKALADRLVDPAILEARAEAGARHGAADGLAGAGEALRRRMNATEAAQADIIDRLATDAADRRAYELRRRRWDNWRNGLIAFLALLVPLSLGYGYHLGDGAGGAEAYARTRDEKDAANWANTPNGKLARRIDQASQQTIPDIATCPSENGWHSVKQSGRRFCYGTSRDAKMISSWVLP